MASTKKKVVTKDDLRRLMKEKQSFAKGIVKKVDHPLAKYNSLNQLLCALCNTVLKNELLWPAHIQSKQHKERVLELKTQGPTLPDSNLVAKRKNESDLKSDAKKFKSGSDKKETDVKKSNNTKERVKAALLASYSSSSDDSEVDDPPEVNVNLSAAAESTSKLSSEVTSGGQLPDDFFDADKQNEQPDTKKMSELLPEGFFDDPKLDAKVRKVEYKDKDEEQWDLFQKAIKEEAQVSEVIMEEDEQQVNIERNIHEIDDQIHCWQEVENLYVKKEKIVKSNKPEECKDNSDDDVEDEELDTLLNWRAKDSLK